MLMKHLKLFFALITALLSGYATAGAEIVQNYTMNFDKFISTSAHDFSVASGWGHIVSYYKGTYQDYYVEYSYQSDGGRTGGALECGKQGEMGGYYDSGTTNDLLVTPKVKGNVSIYVKKYSYSNTGIKFYKVTKDGNTYTVGDEILPTAEPAYDYSNWNKVELPELTEETYIGIRASSILIDDFSASQADVVKMPGLLIKSVKYNGSDKPLCNADGKFGVSFATTIQNTGDLDLTPGMEGYSLSVVKTNSSEVMFTMPINESLAVGATTTVDVAGEIDGNANPNYSRYDIEENIGSTSQYGAYITPVPYKPILEVRDINGAVSSGMQLAFGMIQTDATRSFTLTNAGGAPLNNIAISVPNGFIVNATQQLLAAGESMTLSITARCDAPGTYEGDVMISADDITDFKIGVSATVLDPKKFYVTFEDNKLPAGSYIEQNWQIEQRDHDGTGNTYLLKNNRPGADDKFVTPLLKVAEGEKLSFEACRVSIWSEGSDKYLNVYYSADRKNWTLARSISSSEMSSEQGSSSYNYSFGKLTPFTIDNIPAGNYYIGFGAGYTCIDNIYGFEPVEVAHDIRYMSGSLAKKGMVNYAYNASAIFQNINTKTEAKDSYTASLHFGDKVVATAKGNGMEAGENDTLSLSFTPHEAGTYRVFVTLDGADGINVSSDTIDVAIEEETLKSTFTVGSGATSSANVFVYWYNADAGVDDDVLYPASMLKKYGLSEGAKIKSLTFTGTTSNNKTLANTTLEARVAMTDEASFSPCSDYEKMPVVKIYDGESVTISSEESLVTTINLAEPIVWDGVSALRVFTHAKSNGYASVYYRCDDEVKNSYYRMYSLSQPNFNPVVDIEVEAQPTTLSGTVKCGDVGIEGATVTLKSSDDVVYSGTTAADGTFSINVLQFAKTYSLTVSARGYVDYTEKDVTFTSDAVRNIVLKRATVSVKGKVVFKKKGVAGAAVTLMSGSLKYSATTDETGEYAFESVEPDKAYDVTATAEKFFDYTAEKAVEVVSDTTLADIVLSKPLFKVTGTVKWGETPVENVLVQYTDDENTKMAVYTAADGSYTLANLNPERNYTLRVIDLSKEFNDLTDGEALDESDDCVRNFQLSIKPITIAVDKSEYATFSYKRAISLSGTTGVKAYIVTSINKNYTELQEVCEIPAGTGVLLEGEGSWEVTPIEKTDAAVEGNLLVATTEADYTISADNVGKAWALTYDGTMNMFSSVQGTVVAKGSAYLACESEEQIIYLNQTDGIHSATATNVNSMFDEMRPMYNLSGQLVGKGFKGVVIQDGRKFYKK